MTPEEIQEHKDNIDKMTHYDMAHHWRFAPVGDPYFSVVALSDHFKLRFDEFGGWTPEISKAVGH